MGHPRATLLSSSIIPITLETKFGGYIYSFEEENYGQDPDEHKLERAWDQKIDIRRIFEGSLDCWKDVESLFYAETLHGDFNCRVLRNLRSIHREKAEKYRTKLNESYELVTDLIAAEKLRGGCLVAKPRWSSFYTMLLKRKRTKNEWPPRSQLEDACAQIALYGGNFDSIENNNAS